MPYIAVESVITVAMSDLLHLMCLFNTIMANHLIDSAFINLGLNVQPAAEEFHPAERSLFTFDHSMFDWQVGVPVGLGFERRNNNCYVNAVFQVMAFF